MARTVSPSRGSSEVDYYARDAYSDLDDASSSEEEDDPDEDDTRYQRPGCCTRLFECILYYSSEGLASWIASKVLAKKSWVKDLPDSTRDRLMQMDLICKFALLGVAVPNVKHVEVKDIWPPQEQTYFDETNARCIDGLNIWIPKQDEQSSSSATEKTGVPSGNWKKLKILSARAIDDELRDAYVFESEEEGKSFLDDIEGICLKMNMREHDERQKEVGSRRLYTQPACDEAQGDLAYFGLGQQLLTVSDDKSLGDHMCDLRFMAECEVREAFERYGACAYFRWPGRTITCIYWSHGEELVYPGSDNWEHAKWAWRCSLFLWDTAIFHLVHTHFITSNAVTTSVRSLPTDHPIRRVMHVNTFGNSKVNQEALLTLEPRHGLLHHSCALQYVSLRRAFLTGAKEWKYRTLPQMFDEHNLPAEVKQTMPLYADGMKYWRTLNDFYKAYVQIYYPSENALLADKDMQRYWQFECVPQIVEGGLPPLSRKALADQMTHGVFNVSFYHQLVGDVIRYMNRPNGMCWHIREGEDMADAKALLLTMNIAAKTMRDMPEIIGDDWFFANWERHMIPPNQQLSAEQSQIKQLLAQLKVEFSRLRADLEGQNRTRPDGSRPEFWACSVSL